jgi:peptide methionine sulfoxide reductase MsrA
VISEVKLKKGKHAEAILIGDHKLIIKEGEVLGFFDMRKDPGELNNLAADDGGEYDETIANLREHLEFLRSRAGRRGATGGKTKKVQFSKDELDGLAGLGYLDDGEEVED